MISVIEYYYKSIIIPCIRVAGEFETITDSSVHIYASLKKNRFALCKNAIDIKPKDVTGLKAFFDANKSSFNKLFTTFRRGGRMPVFLKNNEPGRYVYTESSVLDSVALTCTLKIVLRKFYSLVDLRRTSILLIYNDQY